LDEIEIYSDAEGAIPTPRTAQVFSDGPAGMVSYRLYHAVNQRLSRDLEALRQKLAMASVSDDVKGRLTLELNQLEHERQRMPVPRSDGFRAILPLNQLHERVFAVQAGLWKAQHAPRLRLWQTNRWDPLSSLEEPSDVPPALSVRMARSAFVSDVLNLTNSDAQSLDVHLSLTDLPVGCYELFEVPLVDTHELEPVAAALVPLTAEHGAFSVPIPAGMTRQVWVRFCSRGLKEGKYTGRLRVTIDGDAGASEDVAVSVEVFPVSMPPSFSLRLGGWDYPAAGTYEVTVENLGAYVSMLRGSTASTSRGATTPTGKYDADGNLIEKPSRQPMEQWLDRWPEARIYAVVTGHVFPLHTPNRQKMIAQWARDWAEYLQGRGVTANQVAIMMQDEPTSAEELDAILKTGTAIKQSVPGFKIFNDIHFPDPTRTPPAMAEVMKRSCDIQCFALGHLLQEPAANEAFMKSYARSDLEWWCYTGGDSHRLTDPYVTWLARSWFCFANNLSGAHFWSFGDGNGGFSWNEYLNNGVTRSPLYLAKDSITASKSMEAMREGAQDYELLKMVRESCNAENLPDDQAERLRRILSDGVSRVLASHSAKGMMWNVPKDRSVADDVRCEMLKSLSARTDRNDQAARVSSIEEVTRKLQPLMFATFGDSITFPCYHTDFRQNYITLTVDALRKAYPVADVTIVHAGNMGSTARGLEAGRFEKYVLDHRPDVVFLMFGMNDCAAGSDGLDSFDRHLSELIHRARNKGALPVVLTQNEILYDSVDGRRRTALPLYRTRVQEVASREQVPSVDCFAEWEALAPDRTALVARLNDWIHPNLTGHRLFAKSIVETLWPDASRFVAAEVRAVDAGEGEAISGILPGPPGKQILRTGDGTWMTLSCRRRNERRTELVLSFAKEQRPHWNNFQHVTLVGSGKDAVFDAHDRTLTAGLLLERKGIVSVVFSWNVGTFYVTLDTNGADWTNRVRQPGTWLAHTQDPFVRPTILTSASRDGAILHDGVLQTDGRPAVLCTDLKLAAGAGYEIVEGEEGIALFTGEQGVASRFPSFHAVQCLQSSDSRIHFLAQQRRGGPWQIGMLGSSQVETSQQAGTECFVPAGASAFRAMVRDGSGSGVWMLLARDSNGILSSTELKPPGAAAVGRFNPLPWTDGAREGIHWFEVPLGQPAFAFQSRVPAGTREVGLLVDRRGRLEFLVQSLR
jgi:lysophospholipase L1-like esterase